MKTQLQFQYVNELRLEERYAKHKDIAHKYLTNIQFYPDEKIEELIKMGVFKSKEHANNLLFDIPLSSET